MSRRNRPASSRTDQRVNGKGAERSRICVVGPGWRFTSGLSYYTCRLATALASRQVTSVILIRRLLPRVLYPGRSRVGHIRPRLTYPPDLPIFDGIDWWWGFSLVRALAFLRRQRPEVLVLQWWTATTLHTYLVLLAAARLFRIRVVIEMHEFQDPGEAGFGLARHYGRIGLRVLLYLSDGCVVHSRADHDALESGFLSRSIPIGIAAHGPYDQYTDDFSDQIPDERDDPTVTLVREAPRPEAVNILFFGLIRPYKGLEDLLTVFNSFSSTEAERYWLTIVGETWDGCTEPARLIETSPHKDRITFVNRYVPDEVVSAAFHHADVVALPYRRSSSSGTLHIAMSCGLPVVLTSVGGLPEAAAGYGGAIFVPPGDLAALKAGIVRASEVGDHRFSDPRNWSDVAEALATVAAGRAYPAESTHIEGFHKVST
jgi:glycosyltransferase involved in cell wall biosynthesis